MKTREAGSAGDLKRGIRKAEKEKRNKKNGNRITEKETETPGLMPGRSRFLGRNQLEIHGTGPLEGISPGLP